MSNILISYVNDWDTGTVTSSTSHPSFPAINTQQRWFKKTWRTKYGAGSSWGLFRVTASNCKIYFNEGAGNLTATLTVGDYDTTTICTEIKTRMDIAGATYTATYSDTTNKCTIAKTTGTFKLLLSNQVNAAFSMLGWTAIIDTALAASHTAPLIRINTEAFLYCNLGSAKTIKFLALKNHNLQSTATIEVCYYSDAFVTLVATDTMTWHADTIAMRTSRSYQYIAFRFVDIDNPNLYIEIGRAWVGTEFIPHYGFTNERTYTPQDLSIVSSSDDGQESTIQLTHFAEWNYTFDAMTAADRLIFADIFLKVGKTLPCFIAEYPPIIDVGLEAKYVKIIENEEPHLIGGYWGLAWTVRTER